jgi:predicted DNA-binding helix-hairpin-helix protein
LLRVPGLGVTNVDRIIELRRHVPVTLDSLRRMRVHLQTVAPFVLTADKNSAPAVQLQSVNLRQLLQKPSQLNLFDSNEATAVSRPDAGSS